jgi:hypothetical protein
MAGEISIGFDEASGVFLLGCSGVEYFEEILR